MVDLKRRQQLNEALELMHFGFRKMIEKPDQLLASRGMGRMHHRLLYFIGRNEGLSVSELNEVLKISKQALHRPLQQLVNRELVSSEPDTNDKRIRRLTLTRKGRALENRLSRMQRNQFRRVFAQVSTSDERAWREVMALLRQ
ncbi:MAG: MarR family transcriptional regulator [Gammaproteobacteria bacterium]|jgi:DNA-binding MarR family transcriptional regulator|nr:MarR family transcriptional regulator [Gammaproteobacteria bacterium]